MSQMLGVLRKYTNPMRRHACRTIRCHSPITRWFFLFFSASLEVCPVFQWVHAYPLELMTAPPNDDLIQRTYLCPLCQWTHASSMYNHGREAHQPPFCYCGTTHSFPSMKSKIEMLRKATIQSFRILATYYCHRSRATSPTISNMVGLTSISLIGGGFRLCSL